MITSELVRHLARELRIPDAELQSHAEKLDLVGMLDGDDISKATVLLIAAATGEGEGGIVERVKARANMNMVETTLAFRDEKTEVRRPAEYQDAEEEQEAQDRTFAGFVRVHLFWDVHGGHIMDLRHGGVPGGGRIVSISLSRSRPVGIVEVGSKKYGQPLPGTETTLFANIPRSVFETGATVEIPELIPGMENTTVINGDALSAIAVLIRADKGQGVAAA